MQPATQRIVVKLGGVLVLASAGYLGFLHQLEDGKQTQHVVYADALAGGIATACGGITKHTSPVPVVVGEYWSAEKCAEVSRMVTERTQLALLDCVHVRISQPVFDAFSSHAHNFGVAQTCASRALALVNAGRTAEGCDALAHAPDGKTPVWSYADGKYVRGLYNRRLAERAMCLRGLEPLT